MLQLPMARKTTMAQALDCVTCPSLVIVKYWRDEVDGPIRHHTTHIMGVAGLKEAGGVYLYAALMMLLQAGHAHGDSPAYIGGIPATTLRVIIYSDGATKHFKVRCGLSFDCWSVRR